MTSPGGMGYNIPRKAPPGRGKGGDAMGAVKLLAFDLDGTTITEHKYLSPGNREALIKAQAAGVELVPATGRMKTFLPC